MSDVKIISTLKIDPKNFPPPGQNVGFEAEIVAEPTSLIVNANEVSQQFAKMGLTCKENNETAVRIGVSEIESQLPVGMFTVLCAEDIRTTSGSEYKYKIASKHPMFDEVTTIAFNLQCVERHGWAAVDSHTVHHREKTTVRNGLLGFMSTIAQVVGNIGGGGRIRTDQVMKIIEQHILDMRTEHQIDLVEHIRSTLFFTSKPIFRDGRYMVDRIGGVFYEACYRIHDIHNKKVTSHESTLDIVQRNVVFTNPETLTRVHQNVINNCTGDDRMECRR